MGLDPNVIERLLEEHGGVCDICQQPADETLVADHDHETGQFRGFLCISCNMGLGQFADDPVLLLAAAEYLMRTRSTLHAEVKTLTPISCKT